MVLNQYQVSKLNFYWYLYEPNRLRAEYTTLCHTAESDRSELHKYFAKIIGNTINKINFFSSISHVLWRLNEPSRDWDLSSGLYTIPEICNATKLK